MAGHGAALAVPGTWSIDCQRTMQQKQCSLHIIRIVINEALNVKHGHDKADCIVLHSCKTSATGYRPER